MRDLQAKIDEQQSLAPASRTATVNGTGIDLQDYDSAVISINAGAIGGTSPSFTFEVQESDDNSTFTAVAALDLQGTEPVLTAGDSVTHVGYIGNKRYIRAAITAVSGTSPTLVCSAHAILGNKFLKP